jgi:hypothetical protein
LDNLKYSHFFIDLFSLNSVLILIPVFGLTMLNFSKKEPVFKLSGLAVLMVVLLFVATKGKAYYITGLLPFLFAAGGFFAEKLVRQKSILFTGLAILTSWSLLSFPFVIPTLSFEKLEKYSAKTKGWVAAPFMRWEDGNEHQVSQIYADMTGLERTCRTCCKSIQHAYYRRKTKLHDFVPAKLRRCRCSPLLWKTMEPARTHYFSRKLYFLGTRLHCSGTCDLCFLQQRRDESPFQRYQGSWHN